MPRSHAEPSSHSSVIGTQLFVITISKNFASRWPSRNVRSTPMASGPFPEHVAATRITTAFKKEALRFTSGSAGPKAPSWRNIHLQIFGLNQRTIKSNSQIRVFSKWFNYRLCYASAAIDYDATGSSSSGGAQVGESVCLRGKPQNNLEAKHRQALEYF